MISEPNLEDRGQTRRDPLDVSSLAGRSESAGILSGEYIGCWGSMERNGVRSITFLIAASR